MQDPSAAQATTAIVLGMFMSLSACAPWLIDDNIIPALRLGKNRDMAFKLTITTGDFERLPNIKQLLLAFGMMGYPYEDVLIIPKVNIALIIRLLC